MTTTHTLPHILIVEDDPMSRSMLELYLTQEGYPFVSAENGEAALKLYNQNHFSIVITDWLMPEMDGTTLCRAIRNNPHDGRYTFIILITSQNSPEALIEGLEAGADDYIQKPVRPAELRVRLAGCRRILALEDSLTRSLSEIRELSIHDALTGAFNRGYLDHQLEQEIQRAYRYQHPLSLILCDLDHFKLINDTYGHLFGDKVLVSCVAKINSSIRHQIDWMARYGGEEFLITLPETDAAGCGVVAERMRECFALHLGESVKSNLKITASFGTVTLIPVVNEAKVTATDLLQRVDICLYQAKQSGRNCVVSEMAFKGDSE